eukprot:CAMPEP_0204374748 /NCGR_PEP_ID=MMETSP0469-20131031/48817_1 /ASSEMBLY_ACC=CAM_ASM_000384 /TAXON_ID=2969 /ORGANISM="Oxyrrhis marina" /LENGTH=87 /DNA_ID=CAMNT_0051365353 /DNA_START=111 /DNA_END=371 /DNA_ORIENTATION=-
MHKRSSSPLRASSSLVPRPRWATATLDNPRAQGCVAVPYRSHDYHTHAQVRPNSATHKTLRSKQYSRKKQLQTTREKWDAGGPLNTP